MSNLENDCYKCFERNLGGKKVFILILFFEVKNYFFEKKNDRNQVLTILNFYWGRKISGSKKKKKKTLILIWQYTIFFFKGKHNKNAYKLKKKWKQKKKKKNVMKAKCCLIKIHWKFTSIISFIFCRFNESLKFVEQPKHFFN